MELSGKYRLQNQSAMNSVLYTAPEINLPIWLLNTFNSAFWGPTNTVIFLAANRKFPHSKFMIFWAKLTHNVFVISGSSSSQVSSNVWALPVAWSSGRGPCHWHLHRRCQPKPSTTNKTLDLDNPRLSQVHALILLKLSFCCYNLF